MHPQLLLLWSPQLGARSSLDVYKQKMNNKNMVHVHGDKFASVEKMKPQHSQESG